MKRFTMFLVLMMLVVMQVEAQKLKIFKNNGTSEEHFLSEILRVVPQNLTQDYLMKINETDGTIVTRDLDDVDSLKFSNGNLLVYINGSSTSYAASDIASVEFYVAGGGQFGDVVLIPAGTFQMGNTGAYSGWSNELPVHTVTLPNSFYMAKYEVTQGLFKSVMNGYNPSYFIGDTLPVENVCWFEAVDFCNKLSLRDGLQPCYTINMNGSTSLYNNIVTVTCDWTKNGWRLPTEAEWEYAAKAGTSTDFYSGQLTNPYCSPLDNNLNSIAWYCGNSSSKTHNVGGKAPNAFGLYDMSGNVWEWCWDWYGSSYYSGGAMTHPKGPTSGTYRVLRGGSWHSYAYICRSAFRYYYPPDIRYYYNGFRICRTY